MLNRFIVVYRNNGKCKIREYDCDETLYAFWTKYPFAELINKEDVLRSFQSKEEASNFTLSFKEEYDRRIKEVEKEMLNVYTNL